jgi:hypothetical protein
MKKKLGSSFVGYMPVDVFVDTEDRDGTVQMTGDWKIAGKVFRGKITIGIRAMSWSEVVETFLHECAEAAMVVRGLRHTEDGRQNSSSSHGLFVMTHDQFAEVMALCAPVVANILPELACFYKKRKSS